MADFLTTTGISNHLEGIIIDATERLIIVSPYLKVNPRLKELLEEKDRWKIDIRVIYGKSELNPQESSWLESLQSVRTSFCQDLHAKCYMSEAKALITSMNLYEYSQVNNREMGILIDREKDPDLYQDIYQEVNRLLRISEEIRITVAKVEAEEECQQVQPSAPAKSTTPPAKPQTSRAPSQGHCIACKASIALNITRPYCQGCYTPATQGPDRTKPQQCCHMCGDDHPSTTGRPLCTKCYPKYMANPSLQKFPSRRTSS